MELCISDSLYHLLRRFQKFYLINAKVAIEIIIITIKDLFF